MQDKQISKKLASPKATHRATTLQLHNWLDFLLVIAVSKYFSCTGAEALIPQYTSMAYEN